MEQTLGQIAREAYDLHVGNVGESFEAAAAAVVKAHEERKAIELCAVKDPKAKMPYVKITRPDSHGGNFCAYPYRTFSIDSEFDGAEIGDKIVLELIEMTHEEFEDLGDFEGW